MSDDRIPLCEIREAAGRTRKGILISRAVLSRFEKLWLEKRGTPLASSFITLLRILANVRINPDQDGNGQANTFVGQAFCFHVVREHDKCRITDVDIANIPPRPHKHSKDMDINRVIFQDNVLKQFALDYQGYCGEYLAEPYLTACNLLEKANENFSHVRHTPQGNRYYRLTIIGHRQRRVFTTPDWRFVIWKKKNAFVVASIDPIVTSSYLPDSPY